MSDGQQATSRPKLGSLTGIRLPFALLVVLNHVAILYTEGAERTDPEHPEFSAWCQGASAYINDQWWVRALVQGAAVALSLFFTLSGFILTYNYHSQVTSKPIRKREFWAARIARVYPLYLLGLLVSLPLFYVYMKGKQPPCTTAETGIYALSSLFLVQSWWPDASTAWNPPGWSLSCEAFFYLLFPFTVGIFDRVPYRKMWIVILGCWIAMVTPAIIYQLLDPDHLGGAIWRSNGFWFDFVKHNPLLRWPEFLAGVAMGRMYALRTADPADTSWRGSGGWMSCLAGLAILGVILVAEHLPYIILHNGMVLPLFFIMIWGLALEGGPLDKVLSNKWIVLLGDATFAMYLLHTSIITFAVVDMVANKKYDQTPFMFLFWATVSTIISSVITYKTFEIPMRRRVRKWLLPAGETK